MEITNPDKWAQFGISGLVIAALFGVLWMAIKTVPAKFESISDKHEATIRELADGHRAERGEWKAEASEDRKISREVAEKQSETINRVVGSLTDAVRELNASRKNA